jgi:hypothetical protein
MRRVLCFVVAAATVAAAGGGAARAGDGPHTPSLEFRGEVIFPTGFTFMGTNVGGLSGIAYDEARGVYYSLSDDQGQLGPVRYYTLAVDVADGRLDPGDVSFRAVTTLLDGAGQPFATGSLDPEGIAYSPRDDQLVLTSEGFATTFVPPWVRRFSLDGRQLGEIPVPDAFFPAPGRGVRLNLAFEAAAVSPNGRTLWIGTEGALVQDGPPATVTNGSRARLLRYDARTGELERQYVYVTDPIAEPPVPSTAFAVNGIADLLPLNEEFLLAMERSFSVGAPGTGNTIKLYAVKVAGADDVNGSDTLGPDVRPVEKRLLLDLRTLGIPLDNVEGMTFGPRLPDGRRSLLLVSDNNFSAAGFTQFLLFAVK